MLSHNMYAMSAYMLGELLIFCLLLSFVQSVQPRLNVTEHDILKTLFDNTGGTAGRWNYASTESFLKIYGGSYPPVIGREWNFATHASGAYLEDPCQNDATSTKPFMGVHCSCTTVSCVLKDLIFPCGDLSGPIPSQIGGLAHLTFLDLGTNSLTGPIPEELGQLAQLHRLYLYSNSLTGPIPNQLDNLAQLKLLILNDNFLTGPIPKKLGNLAQLQQLVLNTNSLTGPIPEELGQLKQLQDIFLYTNSLTGRIPVELGYLTQLQYLQLNGNSLTGQIPNTLGNLPLLQFLTLNSNLLTGQIPSSLGRITALQQLILANNTFTGSVPLELANLKNLNVLLLQNNSLNTGSVSNNAFSFINPQTFTQLITLDMSNNEFTGTIPESIFELPALKVFAAGSNCFSGVLPANICKGTKLNTIAISGLSTADSCNRYYWKDTAFSLYFNGFSAKHFMDGSLPQCIYSMPNMVTVHAAGNALLGDAPFSGENMPELKISPFLRDLNVARNKLTGSISSQLVTAATSSGKLRSLDLSYNRIEGNLSIFSVNAETFVNSTSPLHLRLEVNNLSGDIPASLLPLKDISILAGNLFWCSYDRDDLPANDPTIKSYRCGSDNLTNIFAFGAIVVVIFIIIQAIRHKQKMQHYVGRMKLWLDVADGRRAIDKDIQITHMKRYSDYFRDLRYFVLMIGLAMIVVCIVYVSLSGLETRTITHVYTWVDTAAFLSGETSTILLLFICICMTGLTWYLIAENKWRAVASGARDGIDDLLKMTNVHSCGGEENESRWMWLRIRILPLLRVLVLIVLIWGVLISGNVFYLHILLKGTPNEQEVFKFVFAAFKLVWTMGVTNYLFTCKPFFFGLEEVHHIAFINFWFGGKVKMMFGFNSISSFWIPLLTILVVRPECFHGAFIAADPQSLNFTYTYHYCDEVNSDNACILFDNKTISVFSSLEVPFVYNYTCSSSILKVYVPLFNQMFLFLIVRSALQLFYLCYEIDESEHIIMEQKRKEKSDVMSIVSYCIDRMKVLLLAGLLAIMPTRHLMYKSSQRQASHKIGDERAFSTQSIIWITKAIPAQLGALNILLTFAVLAPELALSIILFIVLESYIYQMVLGRFIVTQAEIILEHKRNINLSDNLNLTLTLTEGV